MSENSQVKFVPQSVMISDKRISYGTTSMKIGKKWEERDQDYLVLLKKQEKYDQKSGRTYVVSNQFWLTPDQAIEIADICLWFKEKKK